jgi:GNAT superfamily N-acetyltransferase
MIESILEPGQLKNNILIFKGALFTLTEDLTINSNLVSYKITMHYLGDKTDDKDSKNLNLIRISKIPDNYTTEPLYIGFNYFPHDKEYTFIYGITKLNKSDLIEFSPYDLFTEKQARGQGVATTIFQLLKKATDKYIKDNHELIMVTNRFRLSHKDGEDKNNKLRRNQLYRNIGCQLSFDSDNEQSGCAKIKNLSEFNPDLNNKKCEAYNLIDFLAYYSSIACEASRLNASKSNTIDQLKAENIKCDRFNIFKLPGNCFLFFITSLDKGIKKLFNKAA